MKTKLLALAAASAIAVAATPAGAATTIAWTAGSDFDSASQTFAAVNASSISFSGDGYFHNHGGTQGFSIFAIVNGVSQSIFSYPTGTPTDFYFLNALGTINFSGGQVTGISITATTPVGSAFHMFGNESFTLNVAAAVPEPGTWAMMLLGFGGIGLVVRRRKSAATGQLQNA